MFLDQRIAKSNVNLESAGSMPVILVVLVVTTVSNMLPGLFMSAGVVI